MIGARRPATARAHRILAVLAAVLLWSWLPRERVLAVSAPLRRAARRLWAARWRRVLIRLIGIYHAVGITLVLAAGHAVADPGTSTSNSNDGVPDNPVFSWMEVKDSH